MFRCKSMEMAERVRFENEFDTLWLALGQDPAMGLFQEQGSPVEPFVLLITDHQAELVERFSSGGWADCPDAHERHWVPIRMAGALADYGLQEANA